MTNRTMYIVLGVIGLILIGYLVIQSQADSEVSSADQVEWSITVGGSRVTLKGDLPNGHPTETWVDGELIDRDPGGDFSWDLTQSLPSPVALIESIDSCDSLFNQIELWLAGGESDTGDSAFRQLAYAQAAINRAESLDCS